MKYRILYFSLVFMLFTNLMSYASQLQALSDSDLKTNEERQPEPQKSNRRMVKILTIDGGGVRSIIPALLLDEIQSRLPPGHHIGDTFDIIAGTSAGGILAFMLSMPDAEGKLKYSTKFIVSEMIKFSQETFSRSLWQILQSGDGWLDAKYSEKPLIKNLKKYFGDTKLSQLKGNIIVPAYDIEKDTTYFFKSSRARNEVLQDYYIRDIAYGTSAAPTYFSPAKIKDVTQKLELVLIDGGVAVNNPTVTAIVHAVELFGIDIDLFVVSIGTGTNYGAVNKKLPYEDLKRSGKLSWANEIISILLYAASSVIDYEAYYVLNFNKPKYYFRFQTTLEPEDAVLDDASPENINDLRNYAKALIQEYDHELTYIVKVLCNGYVPYPEEEAEHRIFR